MKAALLLLLVAGGGPALAGERPAVPNRDAPADGRALVRAMHARYEGRWYRDFMLVQDVTYLRDGREERMTEYISLPGRVRAITGRIEDGNANIYVDGAFHDFEAGKRHHDHRRHQKTELFAYGHVGSGHVFQP